MDGFAIGARSVRLVSYMDLCDEGMRALFAPVWNKSIPFPGHVCSLCLFYLVLPFRQAFPYLQPWNVGRRCSAPAGHLTATEPTATSNSNAVR